MSVGPGDDRTWYDVLAVTPASTSAEIRSAYLQLARRLHPDVVTGRPAGEQVLSARRMREVNAAYEVLGDATARRTYDQDLLARRGSPTATRPATGGRPETSDADPDFERVDDDDEIDDVELNPFVAFALRRLPLIVMMLVAIVIFVLTAYATGHTTRTQPIPDPRGRCIETPAEPCIPR